MTEKQIARKRESLTNAVARAKGRYGIAKGARTGRIEGAAEARARRALEAANADLARFNRDYPAQEA